MAKRAATLSTLILTALICSLSLVIGCSETQPTTTDFSTTTLNLTPRSFPSPPAGMIYEMWLLRNSPTFVNPLPSSVEVKSLGRFGWDQNIYIMRDENNVKRERVFELDLNVLEWQFLAVSIENIDSVSTRPTAIFLWDRIRDPKIDQFLSLKFPLGFDTTVTGFVSMETPSDGDTINDGAGVWFAVYSLTQFRLQDTTDVQSIPGSPQFPRDSARDDSSGTFMDTLGIDSIISVTYSRFSAFNLDTFTVNTVRAFLHVESINTDTFILVDTIFIPGDTIFDTTVGRPETLTFGDSTHAETVIYQANRNYIFRTRHTVKSPSGDTLLFDTVRVNNFSNGFIDLPDLTGTGWHYKGWVVGPHRTAEPSNFVRMNFGENLVVNWEKERRLLYGAGIWLDTIIDSTPIDTLITSYDETGDSTVSRIVYRYSNEIGYNFPGDNGGYSMNRERPPFPGEDFLANLPVLPGITEGGPAWNFLGTLTDTAIAIITIEPDNYFDSTRNFPLILMGRELAPRPPNAQETPNLRLNNMPMMNFSGVTEPFPNARQSWPHIVVEHILR